MKKFVVHKTLILTLVLAGALPISAYPAGQRADRSRSTRRAVDNSRRHTRAREVWVRTELFFGSDRPDGSVVTEAEFRQFINEQITPRFPDGLTLLVGTGQFRGSTGVIVQERSMLLILLYPLQMRNGNRKIEEIREAYRRIFHQESVMRVDNFARVSL